MSDERVLARAGAFEVDVPGFTGPFHALAELLLDKKVDVCDVPVAGVTQGFLERGAEAEGWSLEEATWFLAVCAVLLEMKVGRLLPREERIDEEDLLGGSPDLAYARSIELAAFRHVARWLAERLESESHVFTREAAPPPEFADVQPDLMERVTPERLASSAVSLLRPPVVDLTHVAPIRASVSDALDALAERLSNGQSGPARFRELVSDCDEPIQVVVRFLALLELYKDGRVQLSQAETFGEIEVVWEG